MVYLAAVIGCHGVGKTTLVKKLGELGFKIFDEAPINEFTGKNAFASEMNMLLDNMKINKSIKDDSDNLCISDRFAFLDILIYCEGFVKLGWMSEEQLRTIYSSINNSNHDWELPKVILCMSGSKEEVVNNIRKRNRDGVLKEEDEKYLNTIMELFNDFYDDRLELKHLNPELRSKIVSIPKRLVFCDYSMDCQELTKIMELINK